MKQQRVLQCSSPRQRREGRSSARGTEEIRAVQDGTERFAAMREAGNCCSNTEAVEGARDSCRESFSIGSVSSLTGMSVIGCISYLLLSN